MAALGTVGVSARTGVASGSAITPSVLGGLIGGVRYGAIGRNAGPPNPKAISAITLTRFTTAVTPTAQATLTATFSNSGTATAGHLLLAAGSSDATIVTPSGWTLIRSEVNYTGHYLWGRDAAGGETGLTITLGATTTAELFVMELAGTSLAQLDAGTSNNPGANASTIATGTTGATAQADEITVSSFSWNDSPGTGATLSSVANTSGDVAPKPAVLANLRGLDPTAMDTMLGVAYRFTPAAGAQSATATLSASGGRPTAIIATFKGVVAGDVTITAVPGIVAFGATAPAVSGAVAGAAGVVAFGSAVPALSAVVASSPGTVVFSATSPALGASMGAVAGSVGFTGAAPSLAVGLASSPGAVAFEMPAPALSGTLTVPAVAGVAVFDATVPGLSVTVDAIPATASLTATAPGLSVVVASAPGVVVFSAVAPVLLTGGATVAGVAGVVAFTATAPELMVFGYGGSAGFSYGGDDDPAWSYDGTMDPTFTYA